MYALLAVAVLVVCVAQTVVIVLQRKEVSKLRQRVLAKARDALRKSSARAKEIESLSRMVLFLDQDLKSVKEENRSLRREAADHMATIGNFRVKVGILETMLRFPESPESRRELIEAYRQLGEAKADAAFERGKQSVYEKLAKLRVFVVQEEKAGSRKGGCTNHLKVFSEEILVFSVPLPHPETGSRGLPFEISLNPCDLLRLPELFGEIANIAS